MGVKISNLPAIVTPALTDIFPAVQAGVTYKESFTQLSSLFATVGANSSITSLTGLTGGIVGTTTNNDAAAGYIGEYLEASASGVALVTATPKSVVSLALTAGDWDVWGGVEFIAAVGTTVTNVASGISSTNNTVEKNASFSGFNAAFTASSSQDTSNAPVRKSLAAPTTIYMVAQSAFALSTMTVNPIICARRAR